MPAELTANTVTPAASLEEPHVMAMKTAVVNAQKPTEEEVTVAEVFLVAQPLAAQGQVPARLPQTASNLPLIGFAGLLSLGAAALLGSAGRNKAVMNR